MMKYTTRPSKRLKRATKVALTKLKKPLKWNKSILQKADDKFSLQIRHRDGKCMFSGCNVTDISELQCSHYFGRATKSTRFDPENCITLCWYHHYGSKLLGYEYQKQTIEKCGWDGQYTLFMKKHLGEVRWLALVARSQISMKAKQIKEMVYKILEP